MQVRLAAGWKFSAQQFDCVGQFVQESGLGGDCHYARMSSPQAGDALIDLAGLRDVFSADAVLFIAPRQGWNFDVDDCRVAAQFLLQSCVEFFKEALV